MTGPELRVYKDVAGEWRWRLRAANGVTIADSAEGYTERNDAVEAWERVKAAAAAVERVMSG